MRRTLLVTVLILSVASVALARKQGGSHDQHQSVEQAILQVDHERIQAQINADASALDRLYAADFIGIGPSGRLRNKTQVLSDFTSHDLTFKSITTDEVEVRVYGNTAVETGISIMDGVDKGKTVPRDNRFTRVWVKEEGRWQLVANHYSLLLK
jgi:ketosteroid isomerase-like protein